MKSTFVSPLKPDSISGLDSAIEKINKKLKTIGFGIGIITVILVVILALIVAILVVILSNDHEHYTPEVATSEVTPSKTSTAITTTTTNQTTIQTLQMQDSK